MESLCNKVPGPLPESLLNKRPQHKCFSVIFATFLKTPFFTEPLGVTTSGSSGRYLKTYQNDIS